MPRYSRSYLLRVIYRSEDTAISNEACILSPIHIDTLPFFGISAHGHTTISLCRDTHPYRPWETVLLHPTYRAGLFDRDNLNSMENIANSLSEFEAAINECNYVQLQALSNIPLSTWIVKHFSTSGYLILHSNTEFYANFYRSITFVHLPMS